MTTGQTNDVGELLDQGRAAMLAGDMAAARSRFRRANEIDPACIAAWMELSQALPILTERRECLRHILTLAPENPEALARLRDVERLIGAGAAIATQPAAAPVAPAEAPRQQAEALTCYAHPDRETALSCASCGRPICTACVRSGDVGQACPECRPAPRIVQAAPTIGRIAAGLLVTLVLTIIGGALARQVGFGAWFAGMFVGAITGDLLVRVLNRYTRYKREQSTQVVVITATLLGLLIGAGADLSGMALFAHIRMAAETLPLLLAQIVALIR